MIAALSKERTDIAIEPLGAANSIEVETRSSRDAAKPSATNAASADERPSSSARAATRKKIDLTRQKEPSAAMPPSKIFFSARET